jgi:hypothetical protein
MLSDIALQKITLLPQWVVQNYPDLVGQEVEVFEAGTISVAIRIGQKLVVKIFVPKYDWITDYNHSHRLIQNYRDLVTSHLQLSDFGMLSFTDSDEIFDCPVVVTVYYPESQNLGEVWYLLSQTEKLQMTSKMVKMMKLFHRPVDIEYPTQRILDEFDSNMRKFGSTVPSPIKSVFESIRASATPRIITDNIFLVHGDIHLENILIDKDGNLHLIDFDFCHFAPLFLEIEVIFLFCYMPMAVVPESLEKYYQEPMFEVFEQILSEYSELYDPKYKIETQLVLANQIIPKIGHPKFTQLANLAMEDFTRFFTHSDHT